MCYVRKYQYKIKPTESYKLIRNCPGCGAKSLYYNTNNFCVNANGDKIDVWLIYQCQNCKHTFNLSIYERVKVDDIQRNLYERFLKNDVLLSNKYGIDKTIFSKNKVAIDLKNLNYKIEALSNSIEFDKNFVKFKPGDLIEVENCYGLRIRTDKIVADILNVSRTKEQRLENSGMIEVDRADWDKYMTFPLLFFYIYILCELC